MFYYPPMLIRYNELMLAWKSATLGVKSLKRHEFTRFDIIRACEIITTFLQSQSANPYKRMSLRLISQLIYGVIRIYRDQIEELIKKCIHIQTLTTSAMQPKLIITEKRKKKRASVVIRSTPDFVPPTKLLPEPNIVIEPSVIEPNKVEELIHTARNDEISLREDHPIRLEPLTSEFDDFGFESLPQTTVVSIETNRLQTAREPRILREQLQKVQVPQKISKARKEPLQEEVIQEIVTQMDITQDMPEIQQQTEEPQIHKAQVPHTEVQNIPITVAKRTVKKDVLGKLVIAERRPLFIRINQTLKIQKQLNEIDYSDPNIFEDCNVPIFEPIPQYHNGYVDLGLRTSVRTSGERAGSGSSARNGGEMSSSTGRKDVSSVRSIRTSKIPELVQPSGEITQEGVPLVEDQLALHQEMQDYSKMPESIVQEAISIPEVIPDPVIPEVIPVPVIPEIIPVPVIQEIEVDQLSFNISKMAAKDRLAKIMRIIDEFDKLTPVEICQAMDQKLTKLNMSCIFFVLLDYMACFNGKIL
ncbi:hypothetical protein ABEB36_003620 [Hypothenemus hampei]|uniref:Rad21/Rec8-like protein N-terminal domain-containing protein n=1 Tax=Hypothenemus hampei TaxID=57062 RepID=A0ABD1FDE4_HYPHA